MGVWIGERRMKPRQGSVCFQFDKNNNNKALDWPANAWSGLIFLPLRHRETKHSRVQNSENLIAIRHRLGGGTSRLVRRGERRVT
jgi:hypothetical protein